MINIENPIVKRLITLADIHMTFNEKPHQALHYFNGYDDFVDAAKSEGYVYLGEGYFSQAWTHPAINDYAVKLGFKKEDSGAAYAAFCRDNQGLTGIPTIYGIGRFDSCYCVLLDKLERFEFTGNKYTEHKAVQSLIHWGEVSKFKLLCTLDKEHSDYYKKLMNTCYKIKNFFDGVAKFDLHQGNVMQDKNGNMVITDPVSYTQQEQPERRVISNAKARMRNHLSKVYPLHGNFINCKERAIRMMGISERMLVSTKELKAIKEQVRGRFAGAIAHHEVLVAPNCKKPAFLIARDEKLGIKRNR